MTKCLKRTSRKYTDRPSPPYPANECCGERKRGNDGKMYLSKTDRNGRCRWVVSSSSSLFSSRSRSRQSSRTVRMMRSYRIHDNGGRPFAVRVRGHHVEVENLETGSIVLLVRAEHLFLGRKDPNDSHGVQRLGNTVLVAIGGGQYIHIGPSIRRFSTVQGDRIHTFYSTIGNSDVPYPVAIGDSYVYFLDLDTKVHAVPIDRMDLSEDLFQQYYRRLQPSEIRTVRATTIHPRLW